MIKIIFIGLTCLLWLVVAYHVVKFSIELDRRINFGLFIFLIFTLFGILNLIF